MVIISAGLSQKSGGARMEILLRNAQFSRFDWQASQYWSPACAWICHRLVWILLSLYMFAGDSRGNETVRLFWISGYPHYRWYTPYYWARNATKYIIEGKGANYYGIRDPTLQSQHAIQRTRVRIYLILPFLCPICWAARGLPNPYPYAWVKRKRVFFWRVRKQLK